MWTQQRPRKIFLVNHHLLLQTGLKNKYLEAGNFKAKELEKIIKATPVAAGSKAAESSIYYVTQGTSTITNEKELEEYLLKLRREMLQLLRDDKNIIIK